MDLESRSAENRYWCT